MTSLSDKIADNRKGNTSFFPSSFSSFHLISFLPLSLTLLPQALFLLFLSFPTSILFFFLLFFPSTPLSSPFQSPPSTPTSCLMKNYCKIVNLPDGDMMNYMIFQINVNFLWQGRFNVINKYNINKH